MVCSVKLERVSYRYPYSPGDALADVSLSVEGGKVLCLTGPNGSGKSTLAQIVAGLIQPCGGSIYLDSVCLTGKKDLARLRKRVAMLFQNSEDQLFAETVYSDISFGPKKRGVKGAELTRRVKEASEIIGLDIEKLGTRSPFSLSGGEKRKVALAGIIAMEPEILILDEPFTGLDYGGKRALTTALKRFLKERGAGILIITHDISDVWEISDTYCLLSNGKIRGIWGRHELTSFLKIASEENSGFSQWEQIVLRMSKAGIELRNPLEPESIAESLINHKKSKK